MLSHQLEITLDQSPESLERLLRVVRHRGFLVTACQFEPRLQDCLVSLRVESQRPVPLLTSQLEKLFAVSQVKVTHPVEQNHELSRPVAVGHHSPAFPHLTFEV